MNAPLKLKYFFSNDITTPLHNVYINKNELSTPLILDGGSNSFNNNNSSKGTFFSFQYSDYLRMYLLIGLIGNEEATLTRVADVIQANMKLASGNSAYSLDKAYTHISFDVELEVKPLFIGIPESVLGKSVSSSWNKFTYSGQGGY